MIRTVTLGLGVAAVAAGTYMAYRVEPREVSAATIATESPKEPGAQLAAAYDAVFNDLELLRQKGPGMSRVPNNPLDAHPGLLARGVNAVESDLLKLRAKLTEDGLRIEEGVFALNSLRWRKVAERNQFDKLITGGASVPREAYNRVSKVAMWRHNDSPKAKGHLFERFTRSDGVADERLLDLADEAVAYIGKNPNGAFTKKSGDWQLYAAAIFARKKECLGCHPTVKLNSPIAMSAFAYRKDPN